MVCEVRGVEFINKGAKLMLVAILERMRQFDETTKFVKSPSGSSPYEKRIEYGLYQKLWHPRFGHIIGRFGKLVPRTFRHHFGLVADEEIDVVLDASGFSYGDQWGPKKTERLAYCARRWEKRGTVLILLPQSFGPFTTKRIKKAMTDIINTARLIYARDEQSYAHLVSIAPNSENIRLCPDFTCLVKPTHDEKYNALSDRLCIIPNSRMIDMAKGTSSDGYERLVQKILDIGRSYQRNPFILVHEGERDEALARKIAGNAVEVVVEENPKIIKGIIQASYAVMSSRFHGAVSALTQGVPTLVTSWSHKYEMLMSDLGQELGVIAVDEDESHLAQKMKTILDESENLKTREVLSQKKGELYQKVDQMWAEVLNVLQNLNLERKRVR